VRARRLKNLLRLACCNQTLYDGKSKFGNDRVRVWELRPWRVLVFNEVEQALTYMDLSTAADPVAAALPQVLGFDYIRAMVCAAVGTSASSVLQPLLHSSAARCTPCSPSLVDEAGPASRDVLLSSCAQTEAFSQTADFHKGLAMRYPSRRRIVFRGDD
jgi:hypothetical protein